MLLLGRLALRQPLRLFFGGCLQARFHLLEEVDERGFRVTQMIRGVDELLCHQ
jgi:hypothetical protein